ncbi:MAG: SUMO ligase siz1 [Candelina submexicana]|nr:MAG: SUMO ligase siz1 [Candelina submexicana]
MPANRHTVNTKLVLTDSVVERLQDPSLRVMIYCTSESALLPYAKADVAFPHQIEIKVNLDEVKSSLRGLKNKPGTTRPADITNLVRKRGGYENSIVTTYALTQKKFSLLVNLVRQHSVEELVGRLKRGKHTTKEQVIREMISKAQDTDIVATSTVMSLKCPISTLRIDLPCRSTICSHNQCFDASSFLQMQEQAPTWTCPVCNKIILFEALAVDQYVNDILSASPKSVEQVTIEPNGTWSQNTKPASPQRPNGATYNNSDDDDLVEIKGMRVTSLKSEAVSTPSALVRTPPLSSREPSTASAGSRQTGSKRSIEQVIDLTFSDDEDDEPIRAPKRQTTLNSLNSVPDSRSQTNGLNSGPTSLPPMNTSNPGWSGYSNNV